MALKHTTIVNSFLICKYTAIKHVKKKCTKNRRLTTIIRSRACQQNKKGEKDFFLFSQQYKSVSADRVCGPFRCF